MRGRPGSETVLRGGSPREVLPSPPSFLPPPLALSGVSTLILGRPDPNRGTSRPFPVSNTEKKAPCVKFLSGTSNDHILGRGQTTCKTNPQNGSKSLLIQFLFSFVLLDLRHSVWEEVLGKMLSPKKSKKLLECPELFRDEFAP